VYTLITGAASAKAYRLKNTLGTKEIMLGDYMDLPDVLVQSGKIIALPNPENAAFTHQMLALCLDKAIIRYMFCAKKKKCCCSMQNNCSRNTIYK